MEDQKQSSYDVPRPDLRRAGWEKRLAYAESRNWTAGQLAYACGFDPKGTAIMAARNGVKLRGMGADADD